MVSWMQSTVESAATRDDGYMGRVRGLPCRVLVHVGSVWIPAPENFVCEGPVEAHYAGRKPGVALKASDYTCIPLCRKHRRAWTDRLGAFASPGWTNAERRRWSDAQVAEVQAILGYKP